jgi:hypothetical protein
MTTAHQFVLEPYKGMKTRYTCPQCTKKEFTRYIDTTTGEHVAHDVGMCNRVDNCGHHYTPKAFFADNPELSKKDDWKKSDAYKNRVIASKVMTEEKPISFIDLYNFKGSLRDYEANNFIKFLINRFGSEPTIEVIERYFIGTSKHWQGATIFWQVDIEGKVRTGKIMLYNHDTGKRVKEPFNHIHWAHSLLKIENFNLKQCFFGEHLLKEPIKTVAIVESEKTAVIASLYLPQFVWVAIGSLSNLTAERCEILQGRNVVLYPDLNGFDKWLLKAKGFSSIAKFTVSDLLECNASEEEKKKGLDIADYLLRFDVKDFQEAEKKPLLKESDNVENVEDVGETKPFIFSSDSGTNDIKSVEPNESDLFDIEPTEQKKDVVVNPFMRSSYKPKAAVSQNWFVEVLNLEKFFLSITLPTGPLKLNAHSTIENVPAFIESHLKVVKANDGKKRFLPYLDRLKELRGYLTI